MPRFEYTKWDGSQDFQPQSAEKAFDELSEYLLHYGDQVLRQLDRDEDEEDPEIVELLQQEGLLEKDERGRFVVSPKGVRRIQQNALAELFQTFNRDALGRHDFL